MVVFKEKINITNELKELLSPSMANDPLNSILSIENDVKKGVCHCVGGYKEEKLVLAFVYRIDVEEMGKELVVVCGASKGHNNTKLSIPVFALLAKKHECQYIRIHTTLKALARVLIKHEFYLSEIVVRKKVI